MLGAVWGAAEVLGVWQSVLVSFPDEQTEAPGKSLCS